MNRKLMLEVWRRIAAMTDREFFQGWAYLNLPPQLAREIRERAFREVKHEQAE